MSDPNQMSLDEAERLFNEAMGAEASVQDEVPSEEEQEEQVEETPSTLEDTIEETPVEEAPVVDDWLSKIGDKDLRSRVEEQINKAAQLEHRVRSDDGRVAAFQRKADELKLELQQLKSNRPVEKPAATERTIPKEWEQVIEHDPELAKSIEALLRSEREQLREEFKKEQHTALQPIQEEKQARYVAEERQLLEQAVPGYQDIKQSEMFKGWLQYEASPALQHAYEQSYNHRDFVAVFNQFAVDMISTGRVQAPSNTAPMQTQQSVIDPARASQIAANRERKLEQAPVGSRNIPAPAAVVDPKGPMTVEQAEDFLVRTMNKMNKSG